MPVPPSPSLPLICKLGIHSPGPRAGSLNGLFAFVHPHSPARWPPGLSSPLSARGQPSPSAWTLSPSPAFLSTPVTLSLLAVDSILPAPWKLGTFPKSVVLPQNYDAANEIGAVAVNISTRLGGTVLSCSCV